MFVNVHEAKKHLSWLLEKAHNGKGLSCPKEGRPMPVLFPWKKRPTGLCRGWADMHSWNL